MVLAAYFTTFSILQNASNVDLLLMIGLGIAYIAIGIYGYAFAARSGRAVYPLAYFVIQLVLGGLIVHQTKGVGYTALVLLPLAGHSVVLLPRNLRLVANLAIVITFVAASDLFSADWEQVWSALPIFLAGLMFIVIFTQMAVSEEKARSEVEQLVKDLEEANQHLRQYALQVEELAITKERNRLAREIHDGLGHYLTAVHMQIQAGRAVMKTDPQRAIESLGKAQNLTQEALVDVRRSVSALRDMPVDNLSLHDEIEKMLRGCESLGISPSMKVVGSPRTISPQAVLTIYRSAQEGINNTCKHARAAHLALSLDYSQAEQVRMIIQDDGLGAGEVNGGFGILGVRERVHMLHGEVIVTTSPGKGFCLEICLPG